MEQGKHPYKKSVRAIGITFLVYALLVATHLGEFWPFSIYPMFSQAGNPWSRAIVLDVTETAPNLSWESVNESNLPGTAVAVPDYGVDPIDLANFVSKTEKWDQDRVSGLRSMFRADELDGRSLLVMRARGEMNDQDSVRLYFEPYIVLNNTGAVLNPELPR